MGRKRYENLERMPPESNPARRAGATIGGIVLVVVCVALLVAGLVAVASVILFVVSMNSFGSNK